MTRTETLDTILAFAGPLGPGQDPLQRDAAEQAWAMGAGVTDALLDLIVNPPGPGELGAASWTDAEYEISHVLTMIGLRAPLAFLARVPELLGDVHARATLIEVIGALGREEGLACLAPLAADAGLAQEEKVRLACACGEIGGAAALALLDQLAAAGGPGGARVDAEIAVARAAASRGSAPG